MINRHENDEIPEQIAPIFDNPVFLKRLWELQEMQIGAERIETYVKIPNLSKNVKSAYALLLSSSSKYHHLRARP